MERKDIVDYLTNLFTAAPALGPIPDMKRAYDMIPKPEGFELISTDPPAPTYTPAPQTPPQAPVAPTPAPVAQAPRPVASSPVAPAPTVPTPPVMPAPVAQRPQIEPYSGKYDDNARQALYDQIASKRSENAGWEAIGNVADLNSRVGGGTPLNAAAGVVSKVDNANKTAKADFEAGRTAMVGDQDRALSREDKRAALEATLAAKRESDQLRHEDRKLASESSKALKDLTLGTRNDQFKDSKTQSMRKEIMGAKPYQSYLTVRGMANSVRMATKDPSAYGDLSSIYALVKGLDPTSVVREGEIGLMREVSGLKDRLVGTLEKWGGRGPLTGSQMQDIEKIMGRLEQISADNVRGHAAPTLNQARRMQINEDEILGDIRTGSAEPAPAAAPQGDASGEARRARIAQLRKELGK